MIHAQDFTITFNESDKQFPWDSDKECLLDFIEAKGIEVECLCSAGECGSCRTRLLEGEVEYLLEPKVAPGEGYCLLCVTLPKTDLVLAR
jgi:ferredoxin